MNKAITLMITALALTGGASSAAAKEYEACTQEATVCIGKMVAAMRQRGWIGIEWDLQGGRPEISHVVADSPAAAAGVRVGDVVTAFNDISTSEPEETIWAEMKRALVPGKTITLSVQRNGAARDIEVELVAVPEHIIAQWVGRHVMEHHAKPPDGDSPKP